jgi:hypothetical protein
MKKTHIFIRYTMSLTNETQLQKICSNVAQTNEVHYLTWNVNYIGQ